MEKMSRALERAKMLVGMEVDEEIPTESPSFFDDFNRQCTLTTKQRLYGFAICLAAGLACTFLDLLNLTCCQTDPEYVLNQLSPTIFLLKPQWGLMISLLITLLDGISATLVLLSILVFFNPIKFGITFTFGNLLALGSTAFLIGPKRQFDMMLDPVRIYATAIYISSLIIALFCAFYVHSKLLTLLAVMLEFGGLVWYGLSYIPFARSMVSKIFYACMDTEF